MKKAISCICSSLSLLCISLVLSSGQCSSGDLPPISSIVSGTRDFSITSVSLSYNLSYEYLDSLRSNGFPAIMNDFNYINSYHPGLYMANSSITSFRDILVEGADFSSCEKGPSVVFNFKHSNYSGSSKREFVSYDYQLCERNIISSAPWIKQSHYIEVNVATVMSPSGIQLLWQNSIIMDGTTPPSIIAGFTLSSDGLMKSSVGSSSNSGGASSGSNPRQDVAIGSDDEYDPIGGSGGNSDHADIDDDTVIGNTVSDDLPGGDYYVVPSDSALVISPVLLQTVYSGGNFRSDLHWNAPVRAILDPVELDDGSISPEPGNSIGIITLE